MASHAASMDPTVLVGCKSGLAGREAISERLAPLEPLGDNNHCLSVLPVEHEVLPAAS
jgi:hypothetical protein